MSEKKPKPTCYECGEDIIFDPKVLSKNNRQIPLDPTTRQPHECKEIKEQPKTDPQGFAFEKKESVKAEYVDHTLARPSEVKIFYADNRTDLEKEYRDFQIGKKFAWTRAQYQPIVVQGIAIFTMAFFYETAL